MRIVVLTCDKNTWVLPIFCHFLEKMWPDCTWPIEIVGGPRLFELTEGFTPTKMVEMSDDSIWSDMLIGYLGMLDKDDLILLLLEDYIVSDTIDTAKISACLSAICGDRGVQFIRLNPCPGPSLPAPPYGERIGMFERDAPYLTSTQPTIWRVAHLLSLLRPGENPWQFEINGSERARTLPGVYLGSTETLMPCMNLLRRGKVEPNAAKEVEEKW